MSAFAYISIIEVSLKLLIVYFLQYFHVDKLILYAVLIVIVQFIIRLCYSWYCNRHFKETKYRWIWDKTLFCEMTGFAGWNLFGNLAAITFTQGLNLLLNMFSVRLSMRPEVSPCRPKPPSVNSAATSKQPSTHK